MKRLSAGNVILFVCIAVAFILLCSLGWWQVKRLTWKEALIERVETRMKGQPLTLAEMEAKWAKTKDVAYLPVTLKGAPVIGKQIYYYNTLNGVVGWNVITPFRLENRRFVLVNRGFIPEGMRKNFIENHVGEVPFMQITGLSRNPVTQKPNRFMPDNDLPNRSFFWKSHSEMVAQVSDDTLLQALPFVIDQQSPVSPNGWPKVGTTRVEFPNNHFGYAITWFGLAFSLLLVGGWFMLSRLFSKPDAGI